MKPESNPRFPLYIPSKGRWQKSRRLTSRALDAMGVHYRLVVEPQELDAYESEVGPGKVLELDMRYKEMYDPCDAHGMTKSLGPGPARNFIWDHSISGGHEWHWVMDDNIFDFRWSNHNEQPRFADGSGFWLMEEFVLRYQNIGMAGPHYEMFVPRKEKRPPFTMNTRIYSCNLIRNDLPFRWRGRYNEDTDLSLCMLKSGYCTVLFNTVLQRKTATQVIQGGNTAEFYSHEGTLDKSKMQAQLHPDVSRVMWRFGRWHHYVDYRRFKGLRLRPRKDARAEKYEISVKPRGVSDKTG